jgi:hypothetical protein
MMPAMGDADDGVTNSTPLPLMRRDAPPNRGGLLLLLAVASFILPGMGLPLSIAVWVMASHDIRRFASYELDDDIKQYTQSARMMGIVSTGVNSVLFCMIGAITALILFG